LPAVLLVGINATTPRFGRIWRGMALGLLAVQGLGLVYEVIVRGQAFSLEGWSTVARNQVLQFLPGQLALLTATAFVVAAWRKLDAAYDDWTTKRRGPVLPDQPEEEPLLFEEPEPVEQLEP
jgi:hypothetical protein